MTFRLHEDFVSQFVDKQPQWGPLGYVVYKRTYARPLEDGQTEEFWQSNRRVVEGTYQIQEQHCRQLGLPWSTTKAQRSAQEMFQRIWDFKFLPPGRGLWAMGTDILEKKGSAPIANCGFVSTKEIDNDFAEPFMWAMEMSMLGVGVGFDTLGAGRITIKEPRQGSDVFVVEDSREGWVALTGRILEAYTGRGSLPGEIEYSHIRKSGEPLKTFGGIAAGPQPLIDLVQDIHNILKPEIGKKITSTVITDLFNIEGRCVVSGNVRRSAMLALGSPEDLEFTSLKDPQYKEALLHHRWASNNSVSVKKGDDYLELSKLTAKNGEPGYVWLNNARKYGRMADNEGDWKDAGAHGVNPCSEQVLWPYELCTLVETFPSRHDSLEDYKRTLKFAYLYGKTTTLIPTHNQRTNAIMMKNRRIGTSMSGIVQAMQKLGRREFLQWCDSGYQYVRKLDEVYSDWLCVPRSIKVTTVKPSGTVSNLPGVTPGIHFPHSEYYLRTIRFQSNSIMMPTFEKAGYRIEDDVYSPNTKVVYFPIHEEHFDRAKDEVSMWEQLELAAQMQHYWSDNSVSITVTFKPGEAREISKALEFYETRLKTVSFLPLEDHGYQQAPYQTISQTEFEEYSRKLKPIDWSTKSTHDQIDQFCDGESCLIPTR